MFRHYSGILCYTFTQKTKLNPALGPNLVPIIDTNQQDGF